MRTNKYEIDMTGGPLLGKILLYAVYPVAWAVTALGHLAALIWYRRHLQAE